jgi:lysophospholipase L1-like esterase
MAMLIISWSVIFEIGLRLQQYFGPVYDLDMARFNLNWLSDVVNHKPISQKQRLVGRSMYGDLDGFTFKVSYDDNGVRIINDEELLAGCRNPVSVLFLGDSFIEGYDDEDTLPYHITKYFKNELNTCIKTYNAGSASYSPAIFLPQARKLLPILRPDYVVVDVDETDLFDDFVRYRQLIVRDDRGQNIAVKASPIAREYNIGFIKAREHRLYLIRLVAKLWHLYVHMPVVYEKYRREPLGYLAYLQDHDSNLEQKYSEALLVFRQNLQELAGMLKDFTKDGNRILFIYHPHLEHLKPDAAGRLATNLVSSSVQRTALANDELFFNATEILKQRFGSRPEQYYWNGDMHFNFKGLEEYSRAVAAYMAAAMIKPRDAINLKSSQVNGSK